MKKITTKSIVLVGMFTAIQVVLAQISIPMPWDVPLTLQTFAMALTGVVLGWKLGTLSTIVYILLGAVGVPVFANLKGGAHMLVSYTGGFIWGFIALTLLCGLGMKLKCKYLGVLPGMVGLAICHLLGSFQYAQVSGRGFVEAFMLVSVPYLIKDVASVIIAFLVGIQINKRLANSGLV